jgi:hypothetical protein
MHCKVSVTVFDYVTETFFCSFFSYCDKITVVAMIVVCIYVSKENCYACCNM